MPAEIVLQGARAACWLGLLWVAAPLLRGDEAVSPAARLRDAIVLGTAIPLALAFVGLLTGTACFTSAAALVLLRVSGEFRLSTTAGSQSKGAGENAQSGEVRRHAPASDARERQRAFEGWICTALPALATLSVAWPALVRPLLGGDSLGYHLPNAAAWAHDGTLWLTTTRYWWYPGGSESFASGLLATAGPFALGFAGTAASLLAGQRIAAWLAAEGVRPWVAGALAAAAVTIQSAAFQAGNLENDLWLAAFVLETLWATRYEPKAVARSAALCALLKPSGFAFAAVALAAGKASRRTWIPAAIPFALWLGRDAILWRGAWIPPGSTAFPDLGATTIAAHGIAGFGLLALALVRDGPWTVVLFAGGVLALISGKNRGLQIVAAASLAFFLVQPYGFNDAHPQLASGDSLRYALPFLFAGAIALAPLARRFPLASGGLALAATVAGIGRVAALFDNDATTRGVWFVVALALVVATLARGRYAEPARLVLGMVLVAYAVRLAGSHPVDYFNDAFSKPGARSQFFTWLDEHEPSAMVGWNIRVGAIALVSPGTRTLDAPAADPCGAAARAHALLAASADPDASAAEGARVRERALDCGVVLYRDPAVVVVAPR